MPLRVERCVAQWIDMGQPEHTQRRTAERAAAGKTRAETVFAAVGRQLSLPVVAQKMDGTQKQGYQRTIRAAGGNKLDHRTDQAVQTAYVATGVVRSCMPVVGNGQVAEVHF